MNTSSFLILMAPLTYSHPPHPPLPDPFPLQVVLPFFPSQNPLPLSSLTHILSLSLPTSLKPLLLFFTAEYLFSLYITLLKEIDWLHIYPVQQPINWQDEWESGGHFLQFFMYSTY